MSLISTTAHMATLIPDAGEPGGGGGAPSVPHWAYFGQGDFNLTGSLIDQWTDVSGNGRHITGTGSGRPVRDASGVAGGVTADFQNTQLLLATGVAYPDPATGITVVMGIQFDENTTNTILGLYDTTDYRGFHVQTRSAGTLRVSYGDGAAAAGAASTYSVYDSTSGAYTTGTPYVLTVQMSTAGLVVRVDASPVSMSNVAGSLAAADWLSNPGSPDLCVGARANNSLNLDGDIVELRIIDGVDTTNRDEAETEIAALLV